MPDLAVLMAVYYNDKLQYVTESVQSILTQTFTKYDYYIVFDGPVSSEIDNYVTAINDSRIHLFRLEKNEGLAKALNFLLELILKNNEYKLIARMDADDISSPERFEKQYSYLKENPDIACVGCWYREIDESGKHLSDRMLPKDHEALRKLYFTRTPFAHPSVMYRRQLIEMSGFYPVNTVFMEDNVLWGRALMKGLKFANIQEYLFAFRIDKMFLWRRSGIKYGWNFIVTRFKIIKSLNFPFSAYFLTFIIGLVKMMPAFILRYFYTAVRRY